MGRSLYAVASVPDGPLVQTQLHTGGQLLRKAAIGLSDWVSVSARRATRQQLDRPLRAQTKTAPFEGQATAVDRAMDALAARPSGPASDGVPDACRDRRPAIRFHRRRTNQ